MCTLILLRRPHHPWPLLLAGNRDEMQGRDWLPPARHWPDRPDVVAGLDQVAGGSWMGINDSGVVAVVLNRHGTLGPQTGKRSRGELVLEALDYADASVAAEAMATLNPAAYRPFNLVVADNVDAFFIRHDGVRIEVFRLAEGLTLLTAGEPNDLADPRIASALPLFSKAAVPDPESGDWREWVDILQDQSAEPALTFLTESGFGTTSASLMAVPSVESSGIKPVWLFCDAPRDHGPFHPVAALES